MFRFSVSILFFFSACTDLFAQMKDMDTIVVSASLQAQHEKETGRNIISISGADLQKLPVNSIDDALRYLPGVEVQQRGPQGAQADIIIRGGTFQQVLVLIDGVRLNDPLTGHFNGYIPLHLSEIERIEILKGAAASIHGSDAIGGVINIITKSGTHAEQDRRHKLSAGLEAGEHGLLNTNIWWRMRTKKESISVGMFSNKADGEPLRGTNGFFSNQSASMGLSKDFSDGWRMSFRAAADIRDFNAQNFYTTFISDTASEKVSSFWQQLHVRREAKKYHLHADAAYKSLEDIYRFRPGASANENRTKLLVSQAYVLLRPGKATKFTTGIQYIHKSIRSNDRGNHTLPHAAVFLIATHRLPGQIHINESLRLDWDGNYGAVLVPQFNISWSPSRLTIRASAGKGIRDADFTERYNNANKSLVTSGSIGNKELKTERSWNYEAGADYRISPWLKAGGTVFHRSQQDLIDWTPTAYAEMPNKSNLIPNGTYALATNLSSVQTSGIELDLRIHRNFSDTKRLLIMAGLLLLQSKDENKTPSFYISSHAKALLNTTIAFQHGPLNLSVTALYKKRNTQQASSINASISNDYFLANMKMRYDIRKIHTGFFVQAFNLTDQSYSDLLGARMPGRWLSGGFQIAL